jgi:hypothetical protein
MCLTGWGWSFYIKDGQSVRLSCCIMDHEVSEHVGLELSGDDFFYWCFLVPPEAVREDTIVTIENVVKT